MIDALFDNSIVPSLKKTPFIVVGTKDELNSRYMAIKKANRNAKQRLFITSYDQKSMSKYFAGEKKGINNNQLFDFFNNNLGANTILSLRTDLLRTKISKKHFFYPRI